jgi:hypothetical protein
VRARIRQRLETLESTSVDWISRLPTIDYDVGLSDYTDESEWEEVHHDQTVTVYRNRKTGEVRGVYNDRRSDEEIQGEGGNLEYL